MNMVPIKLHLLLLYVSLTFILLHDSAAIAEDSGTPLGDYQYDVTYNGTNAGKLKINIAQDDHTYVITSTSMPSAVASLFLKGYTSTTRFNKTEQGLQLIEGSELITGKEDGGRSFTIQQDKLIKYGNGDTVPLDPAFPPRAASFPLQLLFEDLQSLTDKTIIEVSSKRARRYQFRPTVADEIDTATGKLATWKVERFRLDRPKTTVTYWIPQSGSLAPVRIIVFNKGKTTQMDLQSD